MRNSEDNKKAIETFFNSIHELKRLEIIRSDTIFGDIGEYLCQVVFNDLKLVKEKTNEGYDALENGNKIQIKYSGSKYAKNIDLGDPSKYDELIIVLKKESAHVYKKDIKRDKDYYFYCFTSKEVKEKFKTKNQDYKLSKKKHFREAIKVYPIV